MNRPMHIFLAEDNPGDVELVREALREHKIDHTLTVASDGREAKRFIQRIGSAPDAPRPDLVLLDLNLPKADGYELIAALHAHPLGSGIPVIVVTSSDARKDRERAAALDVAHYFRKPSELIEYLQLGSIIRDLAAKRGLPVSASGT